MKTITQRASEIAMGRFGLLNVSDEQALATLGQALDEWQASVEERLASIGLGLVPAVPREHVLASGTMRGGESPNPRVLLAYSDGATWTPRNPMPPTQAELTATLAAKYEREPIESEE